VNAESEIEAINMVWGAAGCGVRAMIASTGQGISLMQESLAELSNAQIPCLVVNMMRGQTDYYQETHSGGQGDYRHLVLAPNKVPEPSISSARGSISATSGARRSISSATSCSRTPPRPCPSSRATKATWRRRRGPPPAPRAGADRT
jgi:hypothetical protein